MARIKLGCCHLGAALIGAAMFFWAGCPGEASGIREADGRALIFSDGGEPEADGAPDGPARDGPAQDVKDATDNGTPDHDSQQGGDLAASLPDSQGPAVDLPGPDTWIGVGDIGKPCDSWDDCESQFCAQNTHTGDMYCTIFCDPCAADPCPQGTGCQNAGTAYICALGYPNAPCP